MHARANAVDEASPKRAFLAGPASESRAAASLNGGGNTSLAPSAAGNGGGPSAPCNEVCPVLSLIALTTLRPTEPFGGGGKGCAGHPVALATAREDELLTQSRPGLRRLAVHPRAPVRHSSRSSTDIDDASHAASFRVASSSAAGTESATLTSTTST